ncbi:MAG: hypothetical protein JXB07_18900 [Anaerolineae bacterium]|nr:hypothetical protein [Anaerolineae bacterium]
MTSVAFRRMAVLTCSVKRLSPIGIDGKRTEATMHLTGLPCFPLDPVSEEIRQELELSKPFQALQTFLDGDLDIREKDILVVDGVDYVVRAAGSWRWDSTHDVLRLIVEDTMVI